MKVCTLWENKSVMGITHIGRTWPGFALNLPWKAKENFPNPTKEEGHEDQAWSEGYSERIQQVLAWGL